MHISIFNVVVACAFFYAFSAAATTQDQLQRCVIISNDTARLNCFDAVMNVETEQDAAEPTADQPMPNDDVDTGDWIVTEEKDPMSDKTNVTLLLPAEKVDATRGNVALIIRCRDAQLELFIAWDDYLSDNGRLTLRFGDNAPTSESWGLSTDQTATFASQTRAKSFIKLMQKHGRLAARITPYREGPKTAIFDLAGIENAIPPAQTACDLSF